MQDYVALILTPIWDHRNGGESWVRPNVAAWRMYAPDETRGDDQFICEPANVEVEK